MRYIRYTKYVLIHKWHVFWACLFLRVPIWRAVFHDWHKFKPSEWIPYADFFYGDFKPEAEQNRRLQLSLGVWDRSKEEVRDAFELAWNAHQKQGKHHWQYWLLHPDKPKPTFNFQSHDGSDLILCRIGAQTEHETNVAIIYEAGIEKWWPRPEGENIKLLEFQLRHVPRALKMPEHFAREMVADWIGAGKMRKGVAPVWEWYEYQKREKNIMLHPETQAFVEQLLEQVKQRTFKRQQQITIWRHRITSVRIRLSGRI